MSVESLTRDKPGRSPHGDVAPGAHGVVNGATRPSSPSPDEPRAGIGCNQPAFAGKPKA